MRVEIWSDVVCPWCYIGRRRFDRACGSLSDPGQIEAVYRSYELDPNAPVEPRQSIVERMVSRYGMSISEAEQARDRVTRVAASEGLELDLDRARPANTLDAHRLLQLATLRKIRPAVEERFQRAYFTEGARISESDTLLRLSIEAGLSENDARRVLAGQAFTLQVHNDEQEARTLGARGVPFYVFDRGRTIFGAQPTETFAAALRATLLP